MAVASLSHLTHACHVHNACSRMECQVVVAKPLNRGTPVNLQEARSGKCQWILVFVLVMKLMYLPMLFAAAVGSTGLHFC